MGTDPLDRRLRGYEGVVFRFNTSHIKALQDDESKQIEAATMIAQANVGLSFENMSCTTSAGVLERYMTRVP